VAKVHVIPAQSEGIVMARFENRLGIENCLVEASPHAHQPDGIYVAKNQGLSGSIREALKDSDDGV
jgi:hypothetical protein